MRQNFTHKLRTLQIGKQKRLPEVERRAIELRVSGAFGLGTVIRHAVPFVLHLRRQQGNTAQACDHRVGHTQLRLAR